MGEAAQVTGSSVRDFLSPELRALADSPAAAGATEAGDHAEKRGDARTGPLCAVCGKPIESLRLAHQRESGWVRHRTQGGTNALRCRVQHDEWAHNTCVDRLAAGHANQESFL